MQTIIPLLLAASVLYCFLARHLLQGAGCRAWWLFVLAEVNAWVKKCGQPFHIWSKSEHVQCTGAIEMDGVRSFRYDFVKAANNSKDAKNSDRIATHRYHATSDW